MSIVLHMLVTAAALLGVLWLISKWRFFQIEHINRRWLSGLFLLKVVAGLCVWAVYTYYYPYRNTSDAFRYYDDAMVILSSLPADPKVFFNFMLGINADAPEMQAYYEQMRGWTSAYNYGIAHDNPTVIRLNVIIGLFSRGYYHVHTVAFAAMSMIGTVAAYKAISRWIRPPGHLPSLILLLAMPSLLFWTDGVLKEAPLIMGLGLLLFAWFRLLFEGYTHGRLALLILTLSLLIFIKGYVLVAIIPALIGSLLWKWVGMKWGGWVFLGAHVALFLLALHAHYVFIGGDFLYVLQKKQTDFYNVAELQSAGSTIAIPRVDNVGDFLLHAPGAVYRTYFRPDFRDIQGPFHALAFLEGIFCLVLVALSAGIRQMQNRPPLMLSLSLASAIFTFGVIVGSVVPVLGALTRYKVPGLLLLVMLCCTWIDWSKLGRLSPGIARALKV